MYDQNVEDQEYVEALDGLIPWVLERKEGINVSQSGRISNAGVTALLLEQDKKMSRLLTKNLHLQPGCAFS